MIAPPPSEALREAVAYAACEFARRRDVTPRAMDETVAWRELIACMVGGATRYEHAVAATDAICALLPTPWTLASPDWLRLRDQMSAGMLRLPTRFPREHSRYIAAAVDILYVRGDGLSTLLGGQPPIAMRRNLVALLPGIGPKQASLLLLNLGVTDDLAVLDRHVLRYMTWIEVIDSDRPPRGLREYEAAEAKFRAHAGALGHSVVDVDRAVWLTSRVWGKVFQ